MKTILVCDDERHMVRLIEHSLKRTGNRILTAYSGREALRIMENEPVDLLILDVMLPGQDGFEILGEARRILGPATPKIVMLTARGLSTTREQASAEGVAGFLTKPFSPIELQRTVEAMLQ